MEHSSQQASFSLSPPVGYEAQLNATAAEESSGTFDGSSYTRSESITVTVTDSDGDFSEYGDEDSPVLVDQPKHSGKRSNSISVRNTVAVPDSARLMRENSRLGSKLRSSQQTVALLVARLEKSERTLDLALSRISELEKGGPGVSGVSSPELINAADIFARESREDASASAKASHSRSVVKYTTPPPDVKEAVRLTLRGLAKDVKVPFSFKMMKVAAKILADSPVGCPAKEVTVVVLRKEPHGMNEVGMFSGALLDWRLWEAGILAGDIIHVIAKLPPRWHLSEDEGANMFFYNKSTGERSYQRPVQL